MRLKVLPTSDTQRFHRHERGTSIPIPSPLGVEAGAKRPLATYQPKCDIGLRL